MYVLERGSLYRRSNSGLEEHSSGIIIAVRASAAVVIEVGDPDMIRNSQRLKPGAINITKQGRLFLTLCPGAGAALASLILACKRVLRQSCQSILQSSKRCLRHSSSLALNNSHTGRRFRTSPTRPHVQLKYFDRLSSPIAATTPPPSTKQRNGYSAAPTVA